MRLKLAVFIVFSLLLLILFSGCLQEQLPKEKTNYGEELQNFKEPTNEQEALTILENELQNIPEEQISPEEIINEQQ